MTTKNKLPNIHPGEVLEEEFLVPLDITPYRLAKSMGVDQPRVAAILRGERSITADTALRLARVLGTSAKVWLGLQQDFDLEQAESTLGETLDQLQPLTRA